MSSQHIVFIVNPHSGIKPKQRIPRLIEQHLDQSRFTYDVRYTQAPGHATEIAAAAASEGAYAVAAVGGDGSINEVGRGLLGSATLLAIVPHGSGNGLATHIGIGRKASAGIQAINAGRITTIDTCTVNGTPFLNLAGLGYDGLTAYRLETAGHRGFWAYFKVGVREAFRADYPQVRIRIDDGPWIERQVFMLEVANGPMFGYGVEIVPRARLNDGFFNLLWVNKAHKFRYLPMLPGLLTSRFGETSRLVEQHLARKVEVLLAQPAFMHYDGEGLIQRDTSLTFEHHPASLRVLAPYAP